MNDDATDGRVREIGGVELREVREGVWEIPQRGGMGAPARVFASEALLEDIGEDATLDQLRNATQLPGITAHALCMPDGHQGYGFPVGGVGATDAEDGCISPGAVGFDINCGVRLLRTELDYDDVRGEEEALVERLFEAVPSGLGGGGVIDGDHDTVEAILERGVDWAHEAGYATREDRLRCEDEGRRPDARPEFVPQKAKDRGVNQLGSLGSGNHFLEVQRVTDVFDPETADAYGLSEDQVVVLIHCGSRGLGHQVCSDYVRRIEEEHPEAMEALPDRDLAAAPAAATVAEEYYGAMCAAINFAWVNRQLITHQVRGVFRELFGSDLELPLLYDVAHNIAKREVHTVGVDAGGRAVPDDRAVDAEERELFVHRKGATRAFPAGRPELPAAYRDVGQPVIIPGSMGAGSYVLRGGEASLSLSFGSTAHGAGRTMSRTAAKDEFWGGDVRESLRDQEKIYVKANSGATVAEEAPGVYKDVDEVVRVSDALGIGDRVARTYPICNVKG